MSQTSQTSPAPLEKRVISAPRVGMFNVHIQGDLKHSQFVILTLHDLGCNHSMWLNFLSNPSMEEINRRGAFIHVDVPGQEDEAPDLPQEPGTEEDKNSFWKCGWIHRIGNRTKVSPADSDKDAEGSNADAGGGGEGGMEGAMSGGDTTTLGESEVAGGINNSGIGGDRNENEGQGEEAEQMMKCGVSEGSVGSRTHGATGQSSVSENDQRGGPTFHEGGDIEDVDSSTQCGHMSRYAFPSMQSLGEDLVCVLDQLDVKQVICVGEGAGANIVARFAMSQPERVLGCVLIHCTGTTAGVMESLKDKVMNWKLEQIGMNPSTEAYLCLHRFGSATPEFEKAENREQLQKVIESFQENLRSKINPKNLKRFVQAFMKRSNIADQVSKIKCRVLMVTGSKASFNHTVHNLFSKMRDQLAKMECDILEVDGVANVLEEKPEKFAESLLYFLQGMGLVGGVPMPRVQRSASIDSTGTPPQRNRSMSMEEADMPRGIYSMSPPKSGSPLKGSQTDQLSTSPVKS